MKIEEGVSKKLENNPETKIISQKDYFDQCVEYALSVGFVKKNEKDIFINTYLAPIYKIYLEIIEEVKQSISKENDRDSILAKVIKELNICLKTTERIGSTDPQNILRSIEDRYHFAAKNDTFTEYAVSLLADKIAKVISN